MDIRTDSVDDVLEHYGIKRRSGRYPWGSGDRPYQNSSKHSGDYALNRTFKKAVANEKRKQAVREAINSLPGLLLGPQGVIIANTTYKNYIKSIHNYDRTDYKTVQDPVEKMNEMSKIPPPPPSLNKNLEAVNPKHDRYGTVNNCQYCVVAADMRERGYDVQARLRNDGGPPEDIRKWYNNPPHFTRVEMQPLSKDETTYSLRERAYNAVMNQLEEQGEGARGYFGVDFMWGGGHAMYYKVENGKVNIYNPQNTNDDVTNILAMANPNGYSYLRLDNLTPSEDGVGDAVISRKKANHKTARRKWKTVSKEGN